jgi:hypothetical protein
VNKQGFTGRDYDVIVTLRQAFDQILCGSDDYFEYDSVYNSFRRPTDFDVSDCSLKQIIEGIKLCSDIVVLKFVFVYNPLCVNRMIDFVHDTEYDYPKCVQTLFVVTNCLHDVEKIKTATFNILEKMQIGTNCVELLNKIEFNSRGHKYVIVCDTATKNREYTTSQYVKTRCMCPYYVITIESKSKLTPQLKRCFVEGALYRELAVVLPIATKNPNPVQLVEHVMKTTKSTRRIVFLNERQILLNATATKVLLNKENKVEYRIEEFLEIEKKNQDVAYIMGLSTKDPEQQRRITEHNKKTSITSISDMNVDFLYISMKNRLTIKINRDDRVFVTTFSQIGTVGIGTVRRILHPEHGEVFDLNNDFTRLIYLVELDSAETTRKVIGTNVQQMSEKRLQCSFEPVHYLRCEIYDICQCSDE